MTEEKWTIPLWWHPSLHNPFSSYRVLVQLLKYPTVTNAKRYAYENIDWTHSSFTENTEPNGPKVVQGPRHNSINELCLKLNIIKRGKTAK